MLLDVRNAAFAQMIQADACLEPIATDLGITEGTVWHSVEDCLIFSDLVAAIVYRWSVSGGLEILRQPSNITNGNFLDQQGRLVSCEHATSCVSRTESDGRWVNVLADRYQGKQFNSPNDIIVDSKDRIWFTDPTYGRTSPRVGVLREQELSFQGVYRLDPDGALTLVADDYLQPNGLCLSPDEQTLLVNDTDRGHIRRYDVDPDGGVSGGEVLVEITGDEPGKPDGLKVDMAGNIYCTGPAGIHVLTKAGDLLGIIRTPEITRNFCFGGSDSKDLFIASTTTIFRLRMNIAGVVPRIKNDKRAGQVR